MIVFLKYPLTKFTDLEIENQKMWHFNTQKITIVTGALGAITKIMKNDVSQPSRKPSLAETQKIGFVGTSYITRKVFINVTGYEGYCNYVLWRHTGENEGENVIMYMYRIYGCFESTCNSHRLTT